jgi:Flp pilus assembly protein TadG
MRGRRTVRPGATKGGRSDLRRLDLRREDGQALVEFTLVLVPLLLILFGALEFGRAWNNKNDAVHIANEAARMVAANNLTPANCTSLRNEVTTDGLSSATTITILGATVSYPVEVNVDVPFNPVVGGFLPFLPSTLNGNAKMRAEQSYTGPGTCP